MTAKKNKANRKGNKNGASGIAFDYANNIIKGRIKSPVFIQACAKRWFEMHDLYNYDADEVDKYGGIISSMNCPEGNYGKFKLLDWQCFVLSWLVGFVEPYAKHGAKGWKRVIEEVLIVVPRKAGKSSFIGAFTLADIIEPISVDKDGERVALRGAEIYCCGVSEEMAQITFEKIRAMINADATHDGKRLTKRYKLKANKADIRVDSNGAKIKMLSTAARSLEGYTATKYIVDEIARLPDSNPLNIFRSGFGAAMSPLMIMTTTPSDLVVSAYDNEIERAYEWFGIGPDGKEIDRGGEPRRNYVALMYAALESDDPSDPKIWRMAQPSMGHIIDEGFYKSQYEAAKGSVTDMHNFLTRQLCVPMKPRGSWVTEAEWDNSGTPPPKPERANGWLYYIGIDLSDTRDMTALCVLGVNDKENTQRVWWEVFYPEGKMPVGVGDHSDSISNQVLEWEAAGELTLTPGIVQDHRVLAKRLDELNDELAPIIIAGDQYTAIEDVKYFLEPRTKGKFHVFPKTMAKHTIPLMQVSSWAGAGTIEFQRSSVALAHMKNAVMNVGAEGGMMLQKPADQSKYKIDCMDAFISAVAARIASRDLTKNKEGGPIAPIEHDRAPVGSYFID